VNQFTIAETDPRFSCIWGRPTRREGYRTAWYLFVAPNTGEVTIETSGTNYDTVLAVSTLPPGGACTADLIELVCSDDALGFQSRVTLNVIRGQTYYVEVADWQSGIAPVAELRLSALIRPLDSRWRQVANIPTGGLSRHATAVFNEWIYIIGGEEVVGVPPNTIPVITNRAWAFNTRTHLFTELTSMPGTGFANTTAALLNGKIYLPGGFTGNSQFFDPTHWVYDIATDFWSKAARVPHDLDIGLLPFAWASAVVPPDQASYYLTGGLRSLPELNAPADIVGRAFQYTPATDSWHMHEPMMNTRRYGHTAAWIPGRGICVVGGLTTTDAGLQLVEGDGLGGNLTGAECWNPLQGGATWQPIADMNFPRYTAGSVVGPDGRWYVFGGVRDATAIPEVEVYDPVTNTWQVLDSSFSLGGLPTNPARAWPRGGIVGSTIYVIGGNTFPLQGAVSLVEQLRLPPGLAPQEFQAQMPLVALNAGNTFLMHAIPLAPGLAREDNFIANEQFYNAYYFDWTTFGRATVRLSQIPQSWNLDLAVYNSDKQILGDSTNLNGQDEFVSLTLAPGRYYAVVRRIFPPSDIDPNVFYRIILE
jgi:N-acetylneuraminic acid mutarotase